MMTSSSESETNLPDLPTRILIGTTVTLDLIDETGEPERLVLTLVPDEESDFSEGRLGESTPLAQSLFGKSAGCSIDYGVGGIDKVLVRQVEETQYVPNDDVISRTGHPCVVRPTEQWYIKYGETEWKNQVKQYIEDKLETYSSTVKEQLLIAVDWLKEWGFSREFGLGTRIPWDDKYLIESLSDSTIYMAYYTVADQLQGRNNLYG